MDEAFQGFGQAGLALGGNLGLALFHSIVAGQEQRFGGGVVLLAEQAAAEQGLGVVEIVVSRGAGIGLGLLADQQALA